MEPAHPLPDFDRKGRMIDYPPPAHRPPQRNRNPFRTAAILFALFLPLALQPSSAQPPSTDSDRDGLSDALEQSLLVQFAPQFLIGQDDCARLPAEFRPGISTPEVLSENGTILRPGLSRQGPRRRRSPGGDSLLPPLGTRLRRPRPPPRHRACRRSRPRLQPRSRIRNMEGPLLVCCRP